MVDVVEPKTYRRERSINSVTRLSLALSDAEPRMNYQYVAGIPVPGAAFHANKNGTLLLDCKISGNKLTLIDVVDAILASIKKGDPSAPPEQRAGFHSLSLRLDFPGVPYNLRSVFIDVGRSPAIPDSKPRTYAIAAGRIKICGVSEGTSEDPTLVQLLEALRRELSTWRDAPAVQCRAWERPGT